MYRQSLLLFVCSCFFVIPVYSQTPQNQAPKAEFELQVGKATYEVAEGRPFYVTTPKGERIELTFRRKEVLRFTDYGLSFNYHPSMKVSSEKEVGVVTVTLETANSLLALIQVYSAPTTPEEVSGALVKTFREEFKSRNAEFLENSGKLVKRNIHGIERTGQAMDFLFAGERMKLEVYAFQRANTVIAILLQHHIDDAELAKKYFTIITDSFQ